MKRQSLFFDEGIILAVRKYLNVARCTLRQRNKFFGHYLQPGEDSVFAMRASKQTTVVRYICITLCETLRDPEEKEAYRNKLATYVDDVFTENLDYVAGRVESQSQSLPIVTDELVNDMPFLQQIFKKEANFVHYKSQTHEHSATCIKYSYQDIRSLVDSM